MPNRELFKLLNIHYKGQTMQFIPAYSNLNMPKFPFATYQTRQAETNYLTLDKRDVVGDKIIETSSCKTTENLLIKCYHKTDEEAYLLRQEIIDLIYFKLSENIRKIGYGIIDINDNFNVLIEKKDNGYIYCYIVSITIDYNHNVTREFNVLKEVELSEDIKQTIKFEEEK